MNAGTMSDCNIVPDDARIIICYMQAAEILYIGAFANGNVVDIASCNNAWSDAGIFSDSYITGQKYTRCNESIRINLWNFTFELLI